MNCRFFFYRVVRFGSGCAGFDAMGRGANGQRQATYRMTGLVLTLNVNYHNGEPYFVEMNTNPGFTEASILPQQAAAVGISIQDLITNSIEEALNGL